MVGRSYDGSCFDLADRFLDEYKEATLEHKEKLAATIQDAIEDWLLEYDEAIRAGDA